MQITNSAVCDTSKGLLYKQIKPLLMGEHDFPLMGFVCETAHSSPFFFDWIFFICAGKKDCHKISDEFEFRQDTEVHIQIIFNSTLIIFVYNRNFRKYQGFIYVVVQIGI